MDERHILGVIHDILYIYLFIDFRLHHFNFKFANIQKHSIKNYFKYENKIR